MAHVIGLDIGTTGCKAALFTADGVLVANAFREYDIQFPQPGWAQQDAETVWMLAQEVLREVVTLSNVRDVAAIGLSVQGEAIIPTDAAGRALRPAILGMDTRTDSQNAWLREHIGAEKLFALTGMPIHTINTLPKLLWLQTHEPDLWQHAAFFFLYEDFIIFKMSGQRAISRCLASRTQMYNLAQDAWCSDILNTCRINYERLSTVYPSGQAIAPMHTTLAESIGFAAPPLIVSGGHDQACSALGVGLTQPGIAMVSTGTAEVMEVALPAPTLDDTLRQGNISVYAHVVDGLYLAMTLNHSGGLLLRWFRDTFSQAEVQQAQSIGSSAYDLILADAPTHPTSLIVLPHFSGSGTPTFDTASKGAILGLTFATTRGELAKAILEGLTLELRLNVELLRRGGIAIDELRAVGGGARSALWLQLKADILGLPVLVPHLTESACWGAALLAAKGAGLITDVKAAAQRVQISARYTPQASNRAAYDTRYRLYQQVYPALADIHHQL